MSEVVNATELEGLLTGGLLAKLIAFVKSGVITAAMNEAEIIAALKAAGVTVSPSTESLVALLCKIILSVVSTAPVQDAAPLGRVALLAKAAAVYADCFGGAKDTPFLNHLRAMRTFANVHQLTVQAGGAQALLTLAQTATPAETTEAEAAANAAGLQQGLGSINWGNLLALLVAVAQALLATKGL